MEKIELLRAIADRRVEYLPGWEVLRVRTSHGLGTLHQSGDPVHAIACELVDADLVEPETTIDSRRIPLRATDQGRAFLAEIGRVGVGVQA